MGVLEGLIAERRQQVIIDSGWLHSLMLRGFPLDNYSNKWVSIHCGLQGADALKKWVDEETCKSYSYKCII